jgi:ferrous iron transport protein A
MHDMIPLKYLAPGQTAQIGQLVGQPDDVHRLEELGLRSGATIQMVQSGSPCIIRLSGSKLCFRECDVFSVMVRPGEFA